MNGAGRKADHGTEVRRRVPLSDAPDRLSTGEREARILGSEIDAALADPRWQAVETLASLSTRARRR